MTMLLLKIKTAFINVFVGILEDIIPVHMKRLILIVTLYHYFLMDPYNRMELLEKLNKDLELTHSGDYRALVFPGLFTRLFWKGDGRALLNADPEQLTQEIVRKIPCYLRYGRKSDMLFDITKLRDIVQQASAQTA